MSRLFIRSTGAVLHLLSEAAWTAWFKLQERRFPEPPPQSVDEAAQVRTEWLKRNRRRP